MILRTCWRGMCCVTQKSLQRAALKFSESVENPLCAGRSRTHAARSWRPDPGGNRANNRRHLILFRNMDGTDALSGIITPTLFNTITVPAAVQKVTAAAPYLKQRPCIPALPGPDSISLGIDRIHAAGPGTSGTNAASAGIGNHPPSRTHRARGPFSLQLRHRSQ